MQTFEDFGRWVGKMGGQEGLALAYEKELGKKVSQSAISGWFTSRKIPEARRPDLKILGWRGPWEWPKAPEEPEGPVGRGYITREEFAEWVGRVKRLEEEMRSVLPLAKAVQDLDERVGAKAANRAPSE